MHIICILFSLFIFLRKSSIEIPKLGGIQPESDFCKDKLWWRWVSSSWLESQVGSWHMRFPAQLLLKPLLESHFIRNVTADLFPLCSLCKALTMPNSTWASKGRTRRSSPWPRRRWSSRSLSEILPPRRKGTSPRTEAPSRRPSPPKPERGRHGANSGISVSTRGIMDGERNQSAHMHPTVLFKHSPSLSCWIFEKETEGMRGIIIPASPNPAFVRFCIADQPRQQSSSSCICCNKFGADVTLTHCNLR